MSELKPCPFCGSENIDVNGWAGNGGSSGPACDDCGCTAETVAEWNTRPIEADLRVQLSAANAQSAEYWRELQSLTLNNECLRKIAEEANKRLEDAEKQEPVGTLGWGGTVMMYAHNRDAVCKLTHGKHPLYTSPIPPADVAELQRRIHGYESEADRLSVENIQQGKRIAELERDVKERAEATQENYEVILKLRERIVELERKEDVPEGWQAVPLVANMHMHDAGTEALRTFGGETTYYEANACYKAMLSAAPKPEGDKQ